MSGAGQSAGQRSNGYRAFTLGNWSDLVTDYEDVGHALEICGCQGSCQRSKAGERSRAQHYSVAPRSSSSPGNSLTDGYFMISLREIFHAFCTIHDSERS